MIDTAAIGIASNSISTAINIAKAMIGIRDAAMLATQTSALTEQLLNAQQAMLSHNAALLDLQTKHFEALENLRKLNESVSQKGRYPLFNLGLGYFAHRVDPTPAHDGGDIAGQSPQETYYLCQRCMEDGRKSVLQVGTYRAICTTCNVTATIKSMEIKTPTVVSPFRTRDW